MATRSSLHRRAVEHNWDDGIDALVAIVRDPACDHGTALYLYWHGAPATCFERGRPAVSRRKLDRFDVPGFLVRLERRLLADDFATRKILFNPRWHRDGPDSFNREDLTRDDIAGVIPAALREPSCRDRDWEQELERRATAAADRGPPDLTPDRFVPFFEQLEAMPVARRLEALTTLWRELWLGGRARLTARARKLGVAASMVGPHLARLGPRARPALIGAIEDHGMAPPWGEPEYPGAPPSSTAAADLAAASAALLPWCGPLAPGDIVRLQRVLKRRVAADRRLRQAPLLAFEIAAALARLEPSRFPVPTRALMSDHLVEPSRYLTGR